MALWTYSGGWRDPDRAGRVHGPRPVGQGEVVCLRPTLPQRWWPMDDTAGGGRTRSSEDDRRRPAKAPRQGDGQAVRQGHQAATGSGRGGERARPSAAAGHRPRAAPGPGHCARPGPRRARRRPDGVGRCPALSGPGRRAVARSGRALYSRRIQRVNERWPLATRVAAALLSRPELVLGALGQRQPVERDGRVLNRRVQAMLELASRFGRLRWTRGPAARRAIRSELRDAAPEGDGAGHAGAHRRPRLGPGGARARTGRRPSRCASTGSTGRDSGSVATAGRCPASSTTTGAAG